MKLRMMVTLLLIPPAVWAAAPFVGPGPKAGRADDKAIAEKSAATKTAPAEPAEKAEAPRVNEVGEFMRAKLVHSQKVLEGLATEDYDAIAKHAQEMSLLSQAASWQVLQTPEYHQHSVEFRRSADALTEAATEKNLDGAALAYMEITLKCVNCHKYVRKVGLARLDPPKPNPSVESALSESTVD